jgi:1-acyl-sn-glycerol-3-phosphate acyltransferase
MFNFKNLWKEADLSAIHAFIQQFESKLPEELRQMDWARVPEVDARVDRLNLNLNSAGFDRWGLHPDTLRKLAPILNWVYRKYFRVEAIGLEALPVGRTLFVGNHGGQIPLDAMMAGMALFMEAEPPRIARAMVERWVPTVPFVSSLFTRIGAMIGDPANCRELLEHDQSVMVFPEGVRGSGKLFKDRYQLQRFGTGFMRLAIESKAPIVPVAIIGTEETYPSVHNFKSFANLIGAPYFPITPFFPLLGPLGLIPLPAKVTVRFGAPILFEGDPQESEEFIREKVAVVKDALQKEIQMGLELRGDSVFKGPKK